MVARSRGLAPPAEPAVGVAGGAGGGSGVGVRLSLAERVVLGLVAEGPTYGFAVARLLEPAAAVGRVFHVPRPVVYRSIDRLIEAGLVVAGRVEAGNRGPQRTLISASPAGRRAAQRWLGVPVGHVRDFRTELLVKLALLGRAGRSSAGLIDAQRRLLEQSWRPWPTSGTRPRASTPPWPTGGTRPPRPRCASSITAPADPRSRPRSGVVIL